MKDGPMNCFDSMCDLGYNYGKSIGEVNDALGRVKTYSMALALAISDSKADLMNNNTKSKEMVPADVAT